jgi:hypothetical protein
MGILAEIAPKNKGRIAAALFENCGAFTSFSLLSFSLLELSSSFSLLMGSFSFWPHNLLRAATTNTA